MAHSPLGPSSGDRWMNCTASVKFTAGLPDTTSEFAAEGTAAHELSEWARLEGKPCKSYIGREIEVEGYTFTVDAEMARYVQEFVDYCEQWPGVGLVEERVHFTAWVPDGWGTADDIRIVEDEALVRLTDLKYGKGVQVFAKNNTQLKLYALGVYQEFGHLYDMKRFILCIHQPRLHHVDETEITIEELLLWARDYVKPAAEEALSGEGTFKAGKWCRFCRGRDNCEERVSEYTSDFEDLDPVGTLPTYELARILPRIPEIKKMCADIEARALSLLQAGEQVGDYKLVAGRSSRSWKDADEAEAALRKVSKLKVKDILIAKLISPAQAEKKIGKDHSIMKEHVLKSQGKPVMVPGDDPRKPLQADANDEFDDLSSDE